MYADIQDDHQPDKLTVRAAEIDTELQQQVSSLLAASAFPALRRVHCDAAHGDVILSGSVSSFYLKQMATAIGLRADGVRTMRNELNVSFR